MKKIVIMPGGFHPFHAGHLSLYRAAKQAFPDAEVFVAATDDTSNRPFPFRIKQKLAQLAGVDPAHFFLVKSPFQCKEITQNFDPNDTVLIYVRSEKDRAKPPQAGGVKKNGEPSYLQPLSKDLQPMSKHAYMTYLPTVEFGPGITSATEIRSAWPSLTPKRKAAMVMSLYPKTQGNKKLVDTVIKMLDTAIIGTDLVVKENQDYIEEKWSNKYKRSIDCSHPRGFSQRAHCAGRKKKVNESSGYSLKGSFTHDLTKSKVWLIEQLAKISPTIETIYILGSWYGNLSLYLNLLGDIKFNNIINVENNQQMLDQSTRMLEHLGIDTVDHMLADANDLDYRQLGPAGAVINCSLTDMDGTDWFKHIPTGTLVALQARDHDPGYQFASADDILKKFPLEQVYYKGSIELHDPETRYNRFMVIGRR